MTHARAGANEPQATREAARSARASEDDAGAQYLTFHCDGQEYGIAILRIQEIKGWEPVTRIPHSASFVLGVMNLRGAVIPVVDLRQRLGLPQRAFDASTVVIVVHAHGGTGEGRVGLVVDAVSEVYNVHDTSIRPPPQFGASTDHAFVMGLATLDEKLLMLLDIDPLVGAAVASPQSSAA